MGSLLDVLREAPEEERPPQRWITVLDEEPAIKAPQLECKIEYLDPDDWERMCRQYKRGFQFGLGWVQLLKSDERARLLKNFLAKVLKDMKGFGRANLPRISPQAVRNATALEKLPEQIDFSESLLDDLATLISHDTFIILHTAATDLNEFGIAVQEKNG